MTEDGPKPVRSPRPSALCPLCVEPKATSARIATFRRGVSSTVSVVDCADCGIFVFHDDTLADGPLTLDLLTRLRSIINRGSPYNTPCDVTREVVAHVRDGHAPAFGPPAL